MVHEKKKHLHLFFLCVNRPRKNSQQSNPTDTSDPVSYECSADSLHSDSDKVPGLVCSIKGTVSTRFFAFGFFHESVSTQPQSSPLGPFRIFSKIRVDIRKSSCTTGINDTGGKHWEQYQAADTLKWTGRQKFIYVLTLLSKGVPTKLLKFFRLKIFFICHRC